MRMLKAKFPNSAALLAAFQDQFAHGGVFVATRMPLPLGEPVVVDVRIPGLRAKSLIRGTVAWRRPGRQRGPRGPLRAGLGIEFLPSEQHTAAFLRALAQEEIVDVSQRRHRRLPVELAVEWRSRSLRDRYHAHLEDIGEGGAFLRSTTFLEIGTPVTLQIAIPGSTGTISIEGRVARTHHSEGEEGMGVEFKCRDSGGARRLKEIVRRIAEASFQETARRAG